MRKPLWSIAAVLVVALFVSALHLPASSAADRSATGPTVTGYPFPLPDFTHPDRPHAPLFTEKKTLIPLLILSGRFDDLTNLSESGTRDKFFPIFHFGTVADYYLQTGLGVLVPAQETYGEHDNGVVMVELGQSAGWYGQDAGVRRRKMLDLADQYVDFARYDKNDNGRIEDAELAVVTLVTSPNADYSCGQTTGVAAGRQLDGKTVAFRTADGGSLTNSLTFAHELGHQSWDMADHYGFGVGAWDIMGPTCAGPNEKWQEPNAWHRLHLTNSVNNVITKDRYITMLPDTTAPYGSNLLYDYDRGTDDYFMLETRARKAGTYDQNIPDEGLVIWRIDERNVRSGVEHTRGVELMRPDGVRVPGCLDHDVDGKVNEDGPNGTDDDGDGKVDEDGPGDDGCSGGSDTDAWDPTDPRTPKRTMDAPWADGTPAKVAVRSIGRNFADQSQAFVDVRGPGILVDAAGPDGRAPTPTLVAGSTVDLSFDVMNTGEATDTFDFTEVVPDGWTATTQQMTLAAGQRATATIKVTVGTGDPANAQHTLFARGRSTTDSSVVTDYGFLAKISRLTTVTYLGDSTVDQSDRAELKAIVRDKFSGAPLPGTFVSFRSGHSIYLSAETGEDGVAAVSWTADVPPAEYQVTVSASPASGYTSSSTSFPLTVEPENANLAITSPTLFPVTAPPPMTIKVTEEADGMSADLTRAGVKVQLKSTTSSEVRTYTGTAGADGIATVPIDPIAGVWDATAELTGGYFTGPAAQAELVVFDPNGSATGAAIGTDKAGDTANLTVSARYFDDSPTGAVTFVANGHVFTGTTVRWLAVAGKTAVMEVTGRLDNKPATLRATLVDKGNDLRVHDLFRVTVGSYDSGEVTTRAGSFTVRVS